MHRINREVFEVHCGHEETVKGAQHFILPWLDRAMEGLLDEVSSGAEWVRIERLEIDLGEISADQWASEQEVVGRFRSVCRERLHQLAGIAGVSAEREMDWEMVRHFLTNGQRPWWAGRGEEPDLGGMVRRVTRAMPERVRGLMSSAAVRQRLSAAMDGGGVSDAERVVDGSTLSGAARVSDVARVPDGVAALDGIFFKKIWDEWLAGFHGRVEMMERKEGRRRLLQLMGEVRRQLAVFVGEGERRKVGDAGGRAPFSDIGDGEFVSGASVSHADVQGIGNGQMFVSGEIEKAGGKEQRDVPATDSGGVCDPAREAATGAVSEGSMGQAGSMSMAARIDESWSIDEVWSLEFGGARVHAVGAGLRRAVIAALAGKFGVSVSWLQKRGWYAVMLSWPEKELWKLLETGRRIEKAVMDMERLRRWLLERPVLLAALSLYPPEAIGDGVVLRAVERKVLERFVGRRPDLRGSLAAGRGLGGGLGERGVANRRAGEGAVADRGVGEGVAADRGVGERGGGKRGVEEREAAERGPVEVGKKERKVLEATVKKISMKGMSVLQGLANLPEEKLRDLLSATVPVTSIRDEDGREGMDRVDSGNGEDLGRVLVENAGLCLLAPYLVPFFGRLGYLNGQKFKDKKSIDRAVYLLQYMATGKRGAPEYLLTLNKVLCGLRPEDVVPEGVRLSRKEMAEGGRLLEAVVANWAALKSTSVDGFRGSFICREGLLAREGTGWVLRIERKEFDILLNSLPWGYALVKLPWMVEHLEVEW